MSSLRRAFAGGHLTESGVDLLAVSGPALGVAVGAVIAAWMFVGSIAKPGR